jgi:hypothetical protein
MLHDQNMKNLYVYARRRKHAYVCMCVYVPVQMHINGANTTSSHFERKFRRIARRISIAAVSLQGSIGNVGLSGECYVERCLHPNQLMQLQACMYVELDVCLFALFSS